MNILNLSLKTALNEYMIYSKNMVFVYLVRRIRKVQLDIAQQQDLNIHTCIAYIYTVYYVHLPYT